MAKNKIYSNINPYPNREEEIRKAKGNPNKNNHSKKKNSNYGGYTAGTYMAGKLAEKARQQERVKLPMWLNITLIALFARAGGSVRRQTPSVAGAHIRTLTAHHAFDLLINQLTEGE